MGRQHFLELPHQRNLPIEIRPLQAVQRKMYFLFSAAVSCVVATTSWRNTMIACGASPVPFAMLYADWKTVCQFMAFLGAPQAGHVLPARH
jgi:hypothetical protein